MTGTIEIGAQRIVWIRSAVTNVAAAVLERAHQGADLGGERMVLPIARPVEPQDLPCRSGGGERMKHRQHRCSPDSRAEEDHRCLTGLQNEAPPWRAEVERIAHPHLLAQVSSDSRMGLGLHAD